MSLYEDLQQERAQEARDNLYAANMSGTSPEEVRSTFKKAQKLGITPDTFTQMSPSEKAQLSADSSFDWDKTVTEASKTSLMRTLGDPNFVNLARDDFMNMGLLERAAWGLSGDPGDPTGSYSKALHNSAARGMLGGFNTAPFLGNADKGLAERDKLKNLESMKARLDAGEDPRKVFDLDPSWTDEMVAQNVKGFQENYVRNHSDLEANVRDAADRISHYARATALYPQGQEMRAVQDAEGWEAARQFFFNGNFLMNMANIGPESAVQYLPSMAVLAGGSVLTGGATGSAAAVRLMQMVTQGVGSYNLDKQASLLGYMMDAGVNIYDSNAVADYLMNSGTVDEDVAKSRRHAAMTAGFDAASMGLAGARLPKELPRFSKNLKASQPPAASLYQKAMENTYVSAAANLVAQGQLQGLMGAAGEATGQLAAEGKITSTADIIAEYAGEHFTAPMEIISAGRAAHAAALFESQKAERTKQAVDQIVKAAQSSPVIQETPEAAKPFLQAVAEDHPAGSVFEIDVNAFSQEEVYQFVKASPTLAEAVNQALENGGKLKLFYGDFVTKVAANPTAAQIIQNNGSVSLPGEYTATEAAMTLDEIDRRTKALTIESATNQPEDFKKSLAAVGKTVGEMLEQGGVKGAERVANKTLLMTHVSNIATETGMTPEEVWKAVGLNGVQDALTEAQKAVDESVQKARADLTGETVGQDGKTLLKLKNGETRTVEAQRAIEERDSAGARKTLANVQAQPDNGKYVAKLRTILRLPKGKNNRSTVLHETAHWFLDARVRLAVSLKRKGAELTPDQKRFVDLTEKAVKWASGKSLVDFAKANEDGQRAGQEKFARTYEQYLKTGHAPTVSLAAVFQKFSAWLRSIYGALRSVPGSELDEDAMQLFDDLFTTREAVREAGLRRQLLLDAGKLVVDKNGNLIAENPADDALVDGVTNLGDEAADHLVELRSRLSDRFHLLRASVERQLRARANAIHAEFREQAKREYAKVTEQQVYNFCHSGYTVGGSHVTPRLAVKELQALGVPQDQIDRLVELRIAAKRPSKKNTVSVARISTRFGYGSAAELAQKLSAFRPVTKEDIDRTVDAMMRDRYPELASEEDISKTADSAIFTPLASKAVAQEINLIGRYVGKDKVTIGQFRLLAEALLSGTTLGNLRPRSHKAAAESAAKKAQAAYSSHEPDRTPGDLDPKANRRNAREAGKEAEKQLEAVGWEDRETRREDTVIRFKRQELLQMQMAEYAEEFKKNLASRMKAWKARFNGKNSHSAIKADYFEQIQHILKRLDIIDRDAFDAKDADGNPVRKGEPRSYAEFVAEANAHEWPVPDMPENLLTALQQGKTIDQMTVAEAKSLFDFMDDLETAGRNIMTVTINGKRVSLQEISNQLADEINAHTKKPTNEMETTQGDAPFDRIKNLVHKFGAAHVRIPALLAALTGDRNGTNALLVREWDKAAGKESDYRRTKCADYLEAFKPLMKTLSDHKARYYASLGSTLTKSQIVAVALNMGNRENISRLIEGSHWYPINTSGANWNETALIKVIGDTLSEEELQAVQRVWDVVGSLKDEAADLERRAGNRLMQEVQPSAITFTVNGKQVTLAGGYYPIAYDRHLSNRSTVDEDLPASALDTLCAIRGTPSTRTGRTQNRAGVGDYGAVSLTFRAGAEGLNSVIHDICWREAVSDMNKIFDNAGPVARAIRNAWGSEYMNAIHAWIRDIGADGRKPEDGGDSLASFLRQGLSVAMLGFNPVTALVQPLGIIQSIALLGGKWVLKGFTNFLIPGRMHAIAKAVDAKSAVMRDRRTTQFRELAEAQQRLNGSRAVNLKQRLTQAAYFPLSVTQLYAVDYPTWIGAYEKALAEGANEEEAVARADRDLLDAQGSGRSYDLSWIERGGPATKLMTVMYTFFNTTANLAMTTWHSNDGKAKTIWRLFLILGLQSALDTVMRSFMSGAAGDDDWDKDLWKKIVIADGQFNLGLFVGLRELSGIASIAGGEGGFGYSGPTGMKEINDLYRLARAAAQNDFDPVKFTKAGVSVASDIFGLPGTVVNRAITAYDEDAPFWAYVFGVPKNN